MELKTKIIKEIISSPNKTIEIINKLWAEFPEYDKDRENLFVLYLNIKNELLCVELHTQGTLDQSSVYPREIIRKGLFCNAGGVILYHNHPSGSCMPSNEDKITIEKVKEACEIMDIKILDNIIIGKKDEYFSFQEEGLL